MDRVTASYKGKTIEMLTSLATLLKFLAPHQAILIAFFTKWADPFFASLEKKLEGVVKTYVGVNSLKELLEASQVLFALQTAALSDLTMFNLLMTRLVKDKSKRKYYTKIFGFDQYYTDAKRNESQSSLINLLFAIQKNITVTIQDELVNLNFNADLIKRLIGYAGTLNDANINQETFKAQRPTNTADAVTHLNEIYNEVMDVVVLSHGYFVQQEKKDIAAELSYTKVLKRNQPPKPPKKQNPPTPTPAPPPATI